MCPVILNSARSIGLHKIDLYCSVSTSGLCGKTLPVALAWCACLSPVSRLEEERQILRSVRTLKILTATADDWPVTSLINGSKNKICRWTFHRITLAPKSLLCFVAWVNERPKGRASVGQWFNSLPSQKVKSFLYQLQITGIPSTTVQPFSGGTDFLSKTRASRWNPSAPDLYQSVSGSVSSSPFWHPE